MGSEKKRKKRHAPFIFIRVSRVYLGRFAPRSFLFEGESPYDAKCVRWLNTREIFQPNDLEVGSYAHTLQCCVLDKTSASKDES